MKYITGFCFLLTLTFVTAVNGQILFQDDFNDGNANGWEEYDGIFSVINGVYNLQSTGFCNDTRSVNGDPNWSDYEVKLDFFIDADSSGAHAAVLFHVIEIASGCDAGKYYQLHMFPNYVGLCEMNYSNGYCHGLVNVNYTITTQQWHNVLLRVEGQTASVFIDDNFVFDYSGLSSYTSGRIGVKSINGYRMLYDNVTVRTLSTEVDIDIKPGSDPNCFNQNEHGVVPVAIFGSSTLDVNQIDVESLSLQGITVKLAGKSGKYLVNYSDENSDGYTDLVLQFEDSDSWVDSGDGFATLTGELLDGTKINGVDTICIVP